MGLTSYVGLQDEAVRHQMTVLLLTHAPTLSKVGTRHEQLSVAEYSGPIPPMQSCAYVI
jgi:hypothetical protein